MAKIKGKIIVDTERCKGCEICITSCPTKVLGMTKEVNKKGYHYACMLNEDDCTGCASCGLVCPDSCITVYKKKEAP